MTPAEFETGWKVLMAQPYTECREYAHDPERQAAVRDTFWQVFKATDGMRWWKVVSGWITLYDKFPTIAAMREQFRKLALVEKPTTQYATNLLEAPVEERNAPWQEIVRAWNPSGGGPSIYTTGVPIIEEYVAKHREDTLTAERLVEWREKAAASP